MTNIRNALMQAAGTAASGDKVYVEDVFSTYLYTGTGSTLAINNGIDLSGEGGLVWIKRRSTTRDHALFDTERGVNQRLYSNYNLASGTNASSLTAFNSNGFTVGTESDINASSETNVSWTFRKQEGFFDVVSFSGSGASGGAKTVSHNLNCIPGMMILKRTSSSNNWYIWHKSIPNNALALNLTSSTSSFSAEYVWGNGSSIIQPTSSQFTAYTGNDGTWVAYLFADGDSSDAQIFGENSDEAIIKTGSYTGTGNTSLSVNLGFEPQWLLIKAASGTSAGSQNWAIYDVMRGWGNVTGSTKYLAPNLSSAAATWWDLQPTSTGFASTADSGTRANESGTTYIYMAIRRGPMKEPSAGTDVYNAVAFTGTGSAANIDSGFPVDLAIPQKRTANQYYNFRDRLRGNKQTLQLPLTSAQYSNASVTCEFDDMNGFHHAGINIDTGYAANGQSSIAYMFRRYPKVFDMAVYSGTGSNLDVTHNLNAVPEMQIIKRLDSGTNADWVVYHKDVPATGSYSGQYFFLNDGSIGYAGSTTVFRDTPTASVFKVGTNDMVNNSSGSYVWYGFASLSGISHVGSYTGTGNDINVTDLGAAARFVFIKRADEWVGGAGGYYVFDTARGIVAGNDVYSLWNSTSAEVTNTDYIDPHSSGFTITSSAPDSLNASGGKYFYLAFA